MARSRKNRFKGHRREAAQRPLSRLLGGARRLGRVLRPVVMLAVILGILGGIGYAGWRAVLRSPYFTIKEIVAEGSAHVDREEVLTRVGLDAPVNIFNFEPAAAEEALLAHPWVATARVTKALPGRAEVSFEERTPQGVAVLGSLYLVDGTGEPFVLASPTEARDLPRVTGLDRETYEADAAKGHARVREALAVARLYALSPLARTRRLSNVHLGRGGRLELILDRTRVVLGHADFKQKLNHLEEIFRTLAERKMDATYILMSADRRRAVVKEVPLSERAAGSLSMRSKTGGTK